MEHTKGPWKYERPSRVMLDAGVQRYAIYTGTELKPEWIGEIHFAKHDQINHGLMENQANARLIAAAPDLLEALEGLTAYFKFMVRDADFHEYKNAVAAIAKAKGL